MEGAYGKFLYFTRNFSVNLKLLKKIKSTNLKFFVCNFNCVRFAETCFIAQFLNNVSCVLKNNMCFTVIDLMSYFLLVNK